MRVIIVLADGSSVDLRVKSGYQPDVFDDLASRAVAMLAITAAVPAKVTQ